MSREFKFRCYDKNEGYMLPWEHLVQAGDLSEMLLHGHEEDADYSKLMQFTGLKDKNGVEIYEGDVLHINNKFSGVDIYGQVYWKGAGFAMITRRGSDTSQGYFEIVTPFTEVIGNIYENPNLFLGGETDD